MVKKQFKNVHFSHPDGKASLYDLTIPLDWNEKIVLFLHGYMGYKDWGAWNLVEDFFVNENYGFLKFNFSHNGGTTDNPIDFSDLDAFSINTYTKELEDLAEIIALTKQLNPTPKEIYLIGHSRGGGIAALQGKNSAISKIALLAPISNIEERFPKGDALKNWKETQIYYRKNGRTLQEMPHHYIQYEDFMQNKAALDIEQICRSTRIPYLVIHGANDTSVLPINGENIASWSNGKFVLLENASHTFGSSQPWHEKALPLDLENACKEILRFFNTTT